MIRSSLSLLPRLSLRLEEHLLTKLSPIVDPQRDNKSIRNLGYVDVLNKTVTLKLPSVWHPSAGEIESRVRSALEDEEVKLNVSFDDQSDTKRAEFDLGPGLENVRTIVSVYSCKGGVGKSTVSANLAYSIAKTGKKVGLLDCDVYGPSLPSVVSASDKTVRRSPLGSNMVFPVEHKSVKLMSLGYVNPKSPHSPTNAAVIRGPMASRVVTQLLKGTDWGTLDVLVLDLPPGTGDVPLTICQSVPVDCAVAVTTPGSLPHADLVKGIAMMSGLGVPTVALVSNMSHFENPATGEKHYLLGPPVDPEGIVPSDHAVSVPLSDRVSTCNNGGIPIVLDPEVPSEISSAYDGLVNVLSETLLELRTDPEARNEYFKGDVLDESDNSDLEYAPDMITVRLGDDGFKVRIFSENDAKEVLVGFEVLAGRNPKNGVTLEDVTKAPGGGAVECERKGNYGYEVTWGNGARIIYSMRAILSCL